MAKRKKKRPAVKSWRCPKCYQRSLLRCTENQYLSLDSAELVEAIVTLPHEQQKRIAEATKQIVKDWIDEAMGRLESVPADLVEKAKQEAYAKWGIVSVSENAR